MVEEKKQEEEKAGKEEAITRGRNLPISTKHAIALCRAIRGRKIDDAMKLLEQVKKKKFFIRMKGEIPHRKRGVAGRYPVKAASCFLKLLKELSANATAKKLDVSELKIFAKADTASRPLRYGRRTRRAKRTHVVIAARVAREEEIGEEKKGEK